METICSLIITLVFSENSFLFIFIYLKVFLEMFAFLLAKDYLLCYDSSMPIIIFTF